MRKLFTRSQEDRGSRRSSFLKGGLIGAALLLLAPSARAQLSGTYTVCSSGCNYSTVAAALTDISSKGVSGPVTVNISPGTYTSAVRAVTAITGVSATNTITFQGTGPGVIITGTSTRLVELTNQKYMTFRNMVINNTSTSSTTYNIYLSNCTYMTFEKLELLRPTNTTNTLYNYYTTGSSYNTLQNSNIIGGYYAVYSNYTSGSTTEGFSVLRNNRITQFYYYGVYSNYGYSNTYEGNYIDSNTHATTGYGARIYYEGAASVKNNWVPCNGGIYYGMYIYYPNYASASQPFVIENNMVGNLSSSGYLYYTMYLYSSSYSNIKVRHNTLANGRTTTGPRNLYFYNSSGSDNEVTNNIFYRNSAAGEAAYVYQVNKSNTWDYNILYSSGGGVLVDQVGTDYYDLASWKSAQLSEGQAQHDMNVNITFMGTYDLHLDQKKDAPYVPSLGNTKDIDGDSRCLIFTTPGADESNSIVKLKPLKGLIVPDTAFVNSPVELKFAYPAEPQLVHWYVNNAYVGEGLSVDYTFKNTGTYTVKQVAEACGGKDSVNFTVRVIPITSAPVAKFIASANSIKPKDVVTFYDGTEKGPATWHWEITPDTSYAGIMPIPRVKFINGTKDSSRNPQVRFNLPGKYKICLTATNALGSHTVCKTDYVTVTGGGAYSIGDVSFLDDSSATIFDDGGPNANYKDNGDYSLLINPCASELTIVVKTFATEASWDYLRIWDGPEPSKGTPLHCTNNANGNYGPGFTGFAGSANAYNCPLVQYDTLVLSSGTAYIEWESETNTNDAGFELFYYSKPLAKVKPHAEFIADVDTGCTNININFTNKSTGDGIGYFWDWDGDFSTPEATTKNTNTPFMFPGTYTVTLIVRSCVGADTFTKQIVVKDPPIAKVSFEADNTNPTTDDVVFFRSTVKECVEHYTWKFIAPSGKTTSMEFADNTSANSPNTNVRFTEVGCYEVRLIAENVTGKDSLMKQCFITVKAGRCRPAVRNLTQDLGITRVKFNTIDHTSDAGVTAYNPFMNSVSTRVEIGNEFELSVDRFGTNEKAAFAAWIDYNNDGDFNDPSEMLGSVKNSSASNWTIKVKIPTLAVRGATVLRVSTNLANQTMNPCGPNAYGEFEDYRVYIGSDITPPVIKLKGNEIDTIEQGYTFVDSGYTAEDNLDGDVTGNVVRTETPKLNTLISGTYVLSYNVSDIAGNKAETKTRTIVVTVDRTPANLVVDQPDTTVVAVGLTAAVPKTLSADDKVDGNLMASVSVSHNIDFTKIGIYPITYSVTDFAGNTATVYRYMHVIDSINPVLTIKGADTIVQEVYTVFNDPGIQMGDNYTTPSMLQDKLTITGKVDVSTVGTYVITYELEDESGNKSPLRTRVVKIVDTQRPLLSLKGDTMVKLPVFATFTETGINISDNYWKNITTWETEGTFFTEFADGKAIKIGSYTIIYKVTDGSGNVSRITRYVDVVDEIAPVIKLVGQPNVNICRWGDYSDAGYTLSDNYNQKADITVTEEGDFTDFKTLLEGVYNLRYKAVDKSGNVSYSEWRSINVKSPEQCATSGIAETGDLSKQISVFPNPSQGQFQVRLSGAASERVRISVLNILGAEVAVAGSSLSGEGTYSIDLSTQPAGVYMLQVTNGKETALQRIVISR